MVDVAIVKAGLQARLSQIFEKLKDLETELETPAVADWDDQATQREDDEVLESLGRAGQDEIRKIRAALARIAANEYGFCTRCGAEIAEDRLLLLPETPFCAPCAAEQR